MTRMFTTFEAIEPANQYNHETELSDVNGWGGYRYIMELGMPQPRLSHDLSHRNASKQKVLGGH